MKGNKAGHMKGPMAPNGPMMANGPMGPCGHMGPGGEMGHMVRPSFLNIRLRRSFRVS